MTLKEAVKCLERSRRDLYSEESTSWHALRNYVERRKERRGVHIDELVQKRCMRVQV